MTDTPPPKRPRGRPKGSKGGGRPPSGREEFLCVTRVKPGTNALLKEAAARRGLTNVAALEESIQRYHQQALEK